MSGPARCATRRRHPLAARASSSRPNKRVSMPAAFIAASSVTPSISVNAARGVRRQRPNREPRAGTRDPEPSTLFVSEDDNSDRLGRLDPTASHQVDRAQRRDHAKGAVKRATVGHRVEMRACHERVARLPQPPGGSHHAHRFPLRSVCTSRPRATAADVNHARASRSASFHAKRRYPPDRPGVRPIGSNCDHKRSKDSPAAALTRWRIRASESGRRVAPPPRLPARIRRRRA